MVTPRKVDHSNSSGQKIRSKAYFLDDTSDRALENEHRVSLEYLFLKVSGFIYQRFMSVLYARYRSVRCRRDNSTVPGPPIQRSYGTHSLTTILTFNSILFWPVKAVGNRITIGTYNMSRTPPINHKSFQITR